MSEKKQFSRKRFFIDRHLQGRYMLTFLIPMLVMLVFMVFTILITSHTLMKNTTASMSQTVTDIISTELAYTNAPSEAEYKSIIGKIQNTMALFPEDEQLRQSVIQTTLLVFGLGLLVVIIQIVLLTIYFSHKVAGPLYRLHVAFKDVIEGNYATRIRLRKGDELQKTAALFNEAAEITQKRMQKLS